MTTPPPDLVPPLGDELLRPRLVDLLARRWSSVATLLVAPGGYGKSTALAQAIRDNHGDPSGIDVYVRVRRRHRDATGVALAVLDALGETVEPRQVEADPAHAVSSALAARSPAVVCLVLDDVHELVDDGSTATFLDSLLRELPANGRLVIAGRRIPPLALSRLRAADQVVYVTDDDLAFTDDELAVLADRHGVDPGPLARFAGWPAMTRLALVAGTAAPGDFLLEEVIAHLDRPEREALAVVSLVGVGDDRVLRWCGIEVPAVELTTRIPLVERLDDGQVRVHDLWTDLLDRLVPADRLQELATRAGRWLRDEGRAMEAVDLALAARAWDEAREAVMATLAAGDARLSALVCGRWLEAFPPEERATPEVVYLRGIVARLTDGPGHGDGDVVEAMNAFRDRGRSDLEACAALEVGLRGWLANDLEALLDVLGRAPRLRAAGIESMGSVQQMGDAVALELTGDFAGALDASLGVDLDALPLELVELCIRHGSTMAVLVGRADEGVALAEELVRRSPTVRNQFVLDVARFQHGDPGPVLRGWEERRNPEVGNQRDDFLLRVFTAMVDASLGRAPDLDGVRRLAWDRSREHTFVALVASARDVLRGDEQGAAATLGEAIDTLGIDDPLARGELGRFIPYALVLLPAHRPLLRSLDLGPSLRARRAVAEALLALRDGNPVAGQVIGAPEQVLTALPLPWSLELAARLTAAGDPRGPQLGRYLLEVIGVPARDQLRAWVDDADLNVGVSMLVASEPTPPEAVVRIELCGTPQVRIGDSDAVGLNRRRVRELLGALALGRRRREELLAALWPDRDTDRARSNLATTLAYLRRVLEPDRRSGEASYHVRTDGELLWLYPSPYLQVDLWEITDHLEAARALTSQKRPAAAMTHLADAIERWAGTPCTDLRALDWFGAELAAFDRALESAGASLGEWLLAEDRPAEARVVGERLLAADPASERAFGVVLGADLAEGNVAAARATADACLAALADVGVRPGATTRMLLRRLDLRLAPDSAETA